MPQDDNTNEPLSIFDQMQQGLKTDDSQIITATKPDKVEDKVEPKKEDVLDEDKVVDEEVDDTKVEDDKDKDVDTDGDTDEDNIFSDIETILGYKVEAESDFEESTEGIAQYIDAHRESAKVEAVKSFEESLKTKSPQAYEVMMYALQGGNPADLFKSAPTIEAFNDNDEQQHKAILKQYYTSKGLDEDSINVLITQREDAGKLKETAKTTFGLMQTEMNEQKEALKKENQVKVQAQKAQDDKFIGGLNSLVSQGKLNNFTVPKADIPAFQQWILDNKIQYAPDGGYQISMPLGDGSDAKETESVLQAAFLLYKKGDIGKLIQRKTETNRITELRKKASSSKTATGEEKKEAPMSKLDRMRFDLTGR